MAAIDFSIKINEEYASLVPELSSTKYDSFKEDINSNLFLLFLFFRLKRFAINCCLYQINTLKP